ncbi:hypothetical protein OAD06_06170 [Flavobacteriaceae bacterium]|jgi:hypothetical protein|nr:hypothetical protein [Flavobacteriaceae bacterium]
MMKKLILFIVLFTITATSFAQMKVFLRYTPERSEVLPTITYFGKKKISDKFHLAIYTLINKNFSEALVGFTYAPKKWIKIGLSSGIENSAATPVGYRFGSSLWLEKDKNSLFSIFEKGDGKDNFFYKSTYKHKISERIHLGLVAWRFHGLGPLAFYNIEKIDSTLWITPLYDFEFEVARVVLGTTIKF